MSVDDDSDLIPEADRIEQETEVSAGEDDDRSVELPETGWSADEADVWEQSQTVADDDDGYDPD